ncbi:MAG TPA: sigma-70 family RNA polymerase sigma factor [Candidatus Dormibacteraeota bacterium]|nr:sigma-70 family RNA polymerase sigma factor [Candidatus Dormibacteraeota bacterium]
MTPDFLWDALFARIEKDVQLRSQSPGSPSLDEKAWDLLERHLRRIAHSLRRSGLLRLTDLDDIVGEALLKLQSPDIIKRVRVAGSVEGYLVVMMRHAALDLRRHEQRQQTALAEIAYQHSLPSQQVATVITFVESDPLDQVLAKLSADDRYLVKLRFWKKLGIQEIADRTGLSYTAAAVRLFRIMRKMKDLYRQLGFPDPEF